MKTARCISSLLKRKSVCIWGRVFPHQAGEGEIQEERSEAQILRAAGVAVCISLRQQGSKRKGARVSCTPPSLRANQYGHTGGSHSGGLPGGGNIIPRGKDHFMPKDGNSLRRACSSVAHEKYSHILALPPLFQPGIHHRTPSLPTHTSFSREEGSRAFYCAFVMARA